MQKYSKYDFSLLKVPVRVMGIYNQKPGLKGYLLTLCDKEDYRLELSHNALKTAMENTYEGQNEKFREAYMKYVYPKL